MAMTVLLEITDKVIEPSWFLAPSLCLSILAVVIGVKHWWIYLILIPIFAIPNLIWLQELIVYGENSDFAVMGLWYTLLTFGCWNVPFLLSVPTLILTKLIGSRRNIVPMDSPTILKTEAN